MVAYMDNDKSFSFLIGAGSQPYMTISINMKGDIMTFWGDESKRKMYSCHNMTELKQAARRIALWLTPAIVTYGQTVSLVVPVF